MVDKGYNTILFGYDKKNAPSLFTIKVGQEDVLPGGILILYTDKYKIGGVGMVCLLDMPKILLNTFWKLAIELNK